LTTIEFKGNIDLWNAILKESGWDDNTGDYIVICTDGKLEKSGNVVTE
jgi:hypothetical protein